MGKLQVKLIIETTDDFDLLEFVKSVEKNTKVKVKKSMLKSVGEQSNA